MVSYEYLSYIFLFGRLAVFVIIVALLILFAVILIKAAKKRRQRNAEAIHRLLNPDESSDDEDTVNISLEDPSNNL
ncbi:MAG: hypothetical protein J6X80_00705 [Lachnospiraceae bacterium]|nr:hypothetical protein [Lachnospiraceae bacterium]